MATWQQPGHVEPLVDKELGAEPQGATATTTRARRSQQQ